MKHKVWMILAGITWATWMMAPVYAAETEERIVGVTESSIAAETEPEQIASQDAFVIDNFPLIYQEPELPTGCEITALTMVLQYYGCDTNKMEMALDYLPTLLGEDFYYDEEGNLMGNDMENYFIGDPTTSTGYICGPGAIVTAANRYFEDHNSSLQAENKTGATAEELYAYVRQNIPVVVWATIDMEERGEVQGWYREDGVFMEWSNNDHGTVLIGYTEDTVILSDPITGRYEASKEDFESVYESRGCKCVIVVS